ncbi:MAG TPA: hypothetical protein VF876_12005 [Burkholderiales bacterium]
MKPLIVEGWPMIRRRLAETPAGVRGIVPVAQADDACPGNLLPQSRSACQ